MTDFFTEGKKRDYGLDVLRAIAILAVILYHYPRHESQLILRAISHFGYWGVDLFFVLSGFLIGGQCFRSMKSDSFKIDKFYWRRFLRTLPNYYVFLGLAFLIEYQTAIEKFDWRYLFFLQNIDGLYYQGHTWSLCIEEHFYLLFPFAAIFLGRAKSLKTVTLSIFAVSVIGLLIRSSVWFYFRPDLIYQSNVDAGFEIYFKYIYYPTFSRLDGLLAGIYLAFVQTFHQNLWNRWCQSGNRKVFISAILTFVVSVMSFYKIGWANTFFSFPLVAVAFAILLLSVQDQNCILNKIQLPGVTLVSVLSYSLYLTHVYGYEYAGHLINSLHLSQWGLGAVGVRFVLVFGAGLLMFCVVERPFLYLRSVVLNRSK